MARELFEGAQEHVIIAGFNFSGEAIFRPLHERMVEAGVSATIFMDIDSNLRVPKPMTGRVQAAYERFIADNWPFGDPLPSVFYDPRTEPHRAGASLHAKCIVVDTKIAFVTSANFTSRAQERNIEVGVCLRDPTFAAALDAQWRGLVSEGLVLPLAS